MVSLSVLLLSDGSSCLLPKHRQSFSGHKITTVKERCLDPAADWFGFEITYSGSIKQKKTKQKKKKKAWKEIQRNSSS